MPFDAVVCHPASTGEPAGHERDALEWIGREVAGLLGIAFAGSCAGRPVRAGQRLFHVPGATLSRQQAIALGIQGKDELLGGIVPWPFVATKVVSHPLVDRQAAAPAGWCEPLGAELASATVPGFSVFDADDARVAYRRLQGLGRVRFKLADGLGGLGQWLLADMEALEQRLASLQDEALAVRGGVLELHVEQARTLSIGEVDLAGECIAYRGVQWASLDSQGRQVYGGSHLKVVRGRLRDLHRLPLGRLESQAVAQAIHYDRMLAHAYPGLCISRRNYDVVQGQGDDARPRSGVLEQSWRVGGATPAELAALAWLRRNPDAPSVRASVFELHGQAAPPVDAEIFYCAPWAAEGPRYKYRTCTQEGG